VNDLRAFFYSKKTAIVGGVVLFVLLALLISGAFDGSFAAGAQPELVMQPE